MSENMVRGIRKLKDEAFTNSLSWLFTDWQISILDKKIAKKPLTKSEREQFSRKIKPKINAIQNLQPLQLLLE